MNYYSVFISGLIVALRCERLYAIPNIKLSSGYRMPIVGIGTWQINPDNVDSILTAALNNGYRHIDTAFVYENEEAIGNSLKKWFEQGGKREDLFITSKLPAFGNTVEDVEIFLNSSLKNLGLQYVDMYLIHFPAGIKRVPNKLEAAVDKNQKVTFELTTDHVSLWKAMEHQVKAGRVKSIGLSNFNATQVDNIAKNAMIKPCNLQVELHIYNQEKTLRNVCAKYNISITSYSTLGSTVGAIVTNNLIKPMQNPVVLKIAKNHNKTAAQILLRYATQDGIIVIPKSSNSERLKQNINIFDFELTTPEMKELSDLDQGEKGRILNFDNIYKGISEHPLFPFHKVD